MADVVSRSLVQTCKVMEATIKSVKTGVIYDLLENGSFLSIEIYENLFTYFLTANLLIKDHRDITKNLPLLGGEEVRISFEDETLKKLYQLKFTVYKHTTGSRIEGDTAQTVKFITLKLVSQEGLAAITTKLSKSYSGTIGSIIKDLMLKIDSNKRLVVDPEITNDITIISNFWTIPEIINFGINISDPADIIFYETIDNKFNLSSIGSLLKQSSIEDLFYLKNPNIKNKIDLIDKIESAINRNQLKNTIQGIFGNTQYKFNETGNIIEKKQVDYNDMFTMVPALGKSININDEFISPDKKVIQGFFNMETKAYREMIINSLINNSCKITLPGKVRHVGSIVNLIYSNDDGSVGYHDLFSGNWLVAEVSYRITNLSTFEQSMKLMKNANFGSDLIGKTLVNVNR